MEKRLIELFCVLQLIRRSLQANAGLTGECNQDRKKTSRYCTVGCIGVDFELRRFNRCLYFICTETSSPQLALTGDVGINRRLITGLNGEWNLSVPERFGPRAEIDRRNLTLAGVFTAVQPVHVFFLSPSPSHLTFTGECNLQIAGSTGECSPLLADLNSD